MRILKKKLFFCTAFFQSKKDIDINEGEPRNSRLRKRTEKYTNAIVALLEKEGKVNSYIRGIDACANEIGCRPEVLRSITDTCWIILIKRKMEAHII